MPPQALDLDAELRYFERGLGEVGKYWNRFGVDVPLRGATVVDVGCGHGALCVAMAEAGAGRVIGVDLDEERIRFAEARIRERYPHLAGRVEFRCQDLRLIPERGIDLVVSKDAFEHITELAAVLDAIRVRLRPGGRLYAGFGPLYNSPYGDHRRLRAKIPWGHLLLSERFLLRRAARRLQREVSSVEDLGLNKLSLRDYERLLSASGMRVVSIRRNANRRLASRAMSVAAKVPFLREYFTHNLFCVLER